MPHQYSTRQYSIFMEYVIGVLLPYFCHTTRDLDAAAAEVVATLHAYGVRTRAEFIKATQIIALSMVTLETLAESTSQELSPSLRLRYRGCANSLTRSTIQCEKALARRLANDSPGKSAHEPAIVPGNPATAQPPPSSDMPQPANDTPQPANATPEPIDDLSDEEATAALEQVRAQIDSHRARLPGARLAGARLSDSRPAPAPLPDPDHPAWAAALMDAIGQGAARGIAQGTTQPTAGPGG